jgi:hypothetical protein
MHLRDSVDELLDPEGLSMEDHEIGDMALLAARDCMAHDIRTGWLELKYRIDVQDQAGAIVHTLHFSPMP